MELYTLGEWDVAPGREEEFVAAWSEFAEWTGANIAGTGWAKLLQDQDAPRRFISCGPWATADAVAAWRQHPEFQRRIEGIQELLEGFTPHTMSLASEVGPATPDP